MNTTLYYPVDNSTEFVNYTISNENMFNTIDNKINFNENCKPLITIKDELQFEQYAYNDDVTVKKLSI